MRQSLLLVLAFFISFCAIAQGSSNINLLKEGDTVPEIIFKTDDGKAYSSADLEGKVYMLVFFATWCPPCLKELPHVQKEIWEPYGKFRDFELFVVGREHTLEEVKRFKESNNYTFPCVADTKRTIFSVFATQNIPRTYLVNKSGKIVQMTSGFNIAKFEKLVDQLKEQLEES